MEGCEKKKSVFSLDRQWEAVSTEPWAGGEEMEGWVKGALSGGEEIEGWVKGTIMSSPVAPSHDGGEWWVEALTPGEGLLQCSIQLNPMEMTGEFG